MRCLLATLEYPPFHGGIAHYYGHLVANWPNDSNISVITNQDYRLQAKSGYWPWRRAFWTIGRLIRQQKIDFILVGQVLPIGTVVWLLSWLMPIKYGVFLHGMDWGMASSQPRKLWLATRVIRRSSVVLAANNYVADLIKENLPEVSSRLLVINPGLDNCQPPAISDKYLSDLRNRYHLNGRQVLLTVGRLVERKGIDKVITALPNLLKKYPQLSYVVVGQGPYLEVCQQLVAKLAISDAVIFIDNADDRQRSAWYQLADIFIMPARQIGGDFEGFGIVYLEANQAGKPVIAGRSGGVGDAVVDGLNGLLINPESIDDIIEAVGRLLDNDDLRQKLGQAGQERLLDFLWPVQAEKISSFINKLC